MGSDGARGKITGRQAAKTDTIKDQSSTLAKRVDVDPTRITARAGAKISVAPALGLR